MLGSIDPFVQCCNLPPLMLQCLGARASTDAAYWVMAGISVTPMISALDLAGVFLPNKRNPRLEMGKNDGQSSTAQ